MQITVNISDDEIKDTILTSIKDSFRGQYETDFGIRDATAAAVKELVYSRKDEIIEKCVDRASRELVRKGMPKLLEKFQEEL